jgi:hypothetical protein
MASEQDKGVANKDQQQNLREREAINDAYSALLGQQNIQTWAAFTFEEAVDAQIEAIEGKSTDKRPNQQERVDRIEQSVLQAIKTLKDTPPEQFTEHDPSTDVNTARESDAQS